MTLTAWEKSVNAHGGINGHPVKVVAKDSAGNAAQGLSVTKSLVEVDHAMVILDFDPGIEQAILPYLQQQKVPAVNALALYPFWNATPGFFALGIPYAPDGVKAGLKILQSQNVKSLAVVACAEVAACAALDPVFAASAPAYGVAYKGTLTVSGSAPSYTSQCLQLKAEGVESVALSVALAVTQKVVADCSAQGFNPTYYFPFQTLTPAVLKISGIKALNLSPIEEWFSTDPAMKSVNDALAQYGDPAKADMTSMFAWTALQAVQAGAAKMTGEPSAASLQAGLESLSGFDAGGLMAAKTSFTPGSPSPKLECYFVGAIQNGKFTQPAGTSPQCLS